MTLTDYRLHFLDYAERIARGLEKDGVANGFCEASAEIRRLRDALREIVSYTVLYGEAAGEFASSVLEVQHHAEKSTTPDSERSVDSGSERNTA